MGLRPVVSDTAGALSWVEEAPYANCSSPASLQGVSTAAAKPVATRLATPALKGIDEIRLQWFAGPEWPGHKPV